MRSARSESGEKRGVERTTSWRPPSVGSLAGQDRRNGTQQDAQVEPERAVLDVLEIEPHPLAEAQGTAPADLPQAGDAGLHVEPAQLPGLVLLDFLRNRGARADQAHVPLEHVEELRDLVEARDPQQPPDAGDAR